MSRSLQPDHGEAVRMPAARRREILTGRADVTGVCIALVVLYLISIGGLLWLGRLPVIPWEFLPYLTFAVVPFAVTVVCLVALCAGMARNVRLAPLGAAIAGLGALAVYGNEVVWIPIAVVLLYLSGGWSRERIRMVALALTSLAFGYATVWNVNYIAAGFVRDRLIDVALERSDAAMYGWWFGAAPHAVGFFPLVRSPLGFRLLERAYLSLFAEVLIAVFWLSSTSTARELGNFLQRLFLAYAVGLVIFLVIPAVGPHIFAPASFDAAFSDTITHRLMANMAVEYRAILTGGPLNGFGYFIAMPSLHVVVAVFVVGAVRRSRLLYWFLQPITTMLVLSTFLLGYHYILDVVVGLPLGWLLVPHLPRDTTLATITDCDPRVPRLD